MKKKYPIGVDDFKKIIDENMYFVDKTMLIKEVIDDGAEASLIARPRRFGKTLNISMLKYYFEKTKEDNSYLFKNFKISKQGEYYINEQGKYPVIHLTFKDVKMNTWENSYNNICDLIATEFMRHSYLLKNESLELKDKRIFQDILNLKGNETTYAKSLELLARNLYKYHNQKVIILIDEYDTLLNEAYIKGYYEDAISFMKVFLNSGLKNNIYLHKGILTGIFRVAKESIFSDMNNLNVSTMLSDDYRDYFGFVESEVKDMLDYYEIDEKMDNIADWYNGYIFGKKDKTLVYNPWSIMMYVKKGFLEPYWINTSGNEIIKKIAVNSSKNIQNKIQDIINGRNVENIKINENIIYNEILKSEESIWSFLLMSGYLKVVKMDIEEDGKYCSMNPPNKEIYYFYRNIIESWFSEAVSGGGAKEMLKALLTGDIETFEYIFGTTVLHTVSVFDTGDDTSENFYHAFVLGMLVYLDKEYEIKSNRESGLGRYDVMIIPKDKHKKGIVIEFKKANNRRNESIDTALKRAKDQLAEKKYEIELIERGIKDIMRLAIAFKGKEVKMEAEKLEIL